MVIRKEKEEKRAPLAAKSHRLQKNPGFLESWQLAGFGGKTSPPAVRCQIRIGRCLKGNLTYCPKPEFLSQGETLKGPVWLRGLSPQTANRAPRCWETGLSPPASGCWGWGWGGIWFFTHLSSHSLPPGMCYERKADLLNVHSHHFPKRLHCFVETGGHDRKGCTGVL